MLYFLERVYSGIFAANQRSMPASMRWWAVGNCLIRPAMRRIAGKMVSRSPSTAMDVRIFFMR
jgi:hypothetical protein